VGASSCAVTGITMSSVPAQSASAAPLSNPAKVPPTMQGYITSQLLPASLSKLGKTVYSEMGKLGNKPVKVGSDLSPEAKKFFTGYCTYLSKALNAGHWPDLSPLSASEFNSFYQLVDECWAAGIPVVFLRRFPKAMKFPNWVVVDAFAHPVIFLGGGENALGIQSLYLAQALAALHDLPDTWVRAFLFAKGLQVPRKCSAQKLIEYGYDTPYQPDLVAAYVCSQWGSKYTSLMRQAVNYHKAHFNVVDYAASIFNEKILPELLTLPIPVQYILNAALAAGQVNMPDRHLIEEEFLNRKLDVLGLDLPPSTQLAARTLVGLLRSFPLRMQTGLHEIVLEFMGGIKVTVREGGIFDFESPEASMTRSMEELSDVFPSVFGQLFR